MYDWLSSLPVFPVWIQFTIGVVLGGTILAVINAFISTDPEDWGCLFSVLALAAIVVTIIIFIIAFLMGAFA